ncbi:MAG: hypothetical protein ACRC8J_07075, partial [Phocaeicola sp.]
PLNLNILVTPYNENGDILSNIKIETKGSSSNQYLVAAGISNDTPSESRFQVKLSGEKNELVQLRKLGLRIQANGQQYSTVGAQPLRSDNYVQLQLIGKLLGGITIEE